MAKIVGKMEPKEKVMWKGLPDGTLVVHPYVDSKEKFAIVCWGETNNGKRLADIKGRYWDTDFEVTVYPRGTQFTVEQE